jgi:hypothetical protein
MQQAFTPGKPGPYLTGGDISLLNLLDKKYKSPQKEGSTDYEDTNNQHFQKAVVKGFTPQRELPDQKIYLKSGDAPEVMDKGKIKGRGKETVSIGSTIGSVVLPELAKVAIPLIIPLLSPLVKRVGHWMGNLFTKKPKSEREPVVQGYQKVGTGDIVALPGFGKYASSHVQMIDEPLTKYGGFKFWRDYIDGGKQHIEKMLPEDVKNIDEIVPNIMSQFIPESFERLVRSKAETEEEQPFTLKSITAPVTEWTLRKCIEGNESDMGKLVEHINNEIDDYTETQKTKHGEGLYKMHGKGILDFVKNLALKFATNILPRIGVNVASSIIKEITSHFGMHDSKKAHNIKAIIDQVLSTLSQSSKELKDTDYVEKITKEESESSSEEEPEVIEKKKKKKAKKGGNVEIPIPGGKKVKSKPSSSKRKPGRPKGTGKLKISLKDSDDEIEPIKLASGVKVRSPKDKKKAPKK